jgi:L-ribulose-5-phosphate 4-epimerase
MVRELKEKAYQANMRLPELGLVLFTFGNASAADQKERVFAIKPSGVPYSELNPNDMILVDFNGKVVEGNGRPSSDTPTHALLYKHWDHIQGIVHTHSTYATAWAQAGQDIPIYGTTHADHLPIDIPCAPVMSDEMIQGEYEYQTGVQILDLFRQKNISPKEIEMVLIECHAPFTWGTDVQKAVYNSAVLEEIAKMAWITRMINPEAPRLKETLIRKHYERKHGPDAYYGQSRL